MQSESPYSTRETHVALQTTRIRYLAITGAEGVLGTRIVLAYQKRLAERGINARRFAPARFSVPAVVEELEKSDVLLVHGRELTEPRARDLLERVSGGKYVALGG